MILFNGLLVFSLDVFFVQWFNKKRVFVFKKSVFKNFKYCNFPSRLIQNYK